MHDKNDIYNLLIESNRLPEGRYNHSTWELLSHGTCETQEALVASVHESMHYALNNTTLFGLLLVVTAYLAREREEYKSQLGELVSNSRNAHEIFATYSSLLLVSPDNATPSWVKDRYHHSYVEYVNEAKQILNGVVWPHLQFVAINAVMRLCFQSNQLAASIDNGTPFDIPFEEYPDSRLKYIKRSITPEYWLSIENDYLKQNPNDLVTQIFMQADGDRIIEEKYGVGIYNEISLKYNDFIYSKITVDILQPCLSALSGDNHLKYLPKLWAFAEGIVPGKVSIAPLKQNTQPEVDFGLSAFENELLKIRTKIPLVHIFSFSDIKPDEWMELQFKYENYKYIYIVSRITEKFLRQFQVSIEEREWLLHNHPDFIVAVLCKRKIDKEDSFIIIILNEPSQIEELGNNTLILSSSSLLLTSDEKWSPWYTAFNKYSAHTVLFDMSPYYILNIMAEKYEVIKYAKFHLDINNSSYLFVCLIANNSLATGIYFIPCSDMLANILVEFLNNQPFTEIYNVEKNSNDDVYNILRFGMTHLIDESIFDFRSLNTN